jgi:type II secretory pathway component PulC
MGESTDEPVGLVVANKSAVLMKLGLQVGDVIRRINGEAVGKSSYSFGFGASTAPVLYLEVSRNGKPLMIRARVELDPSFEETQDRERFKERLVDLHDRYADYAFVPITKDGKPSGVQVNVTWLPDIANGDIIRTIDGASMASRDQVVDALEKGSDHDTIVIKLDRMDQALTLTLKLDNNELSADSALLVAKIKKLSDTSYELPKDLRDAMLANPMALSKGARVVPSVKDGQPDGFKLYAIRPSSVWAALGLSNGDTLTAIDSLPLTSADKALEAYEKLQKATSVKVSITRRGKPMTMTYTIK